ncbi:MAG TPA: nuclear transport factor 2 family protein [Acetobacteraceae bacterium]
MARTDNIGIARELLGRLGSGAEPAAIVELFAEGMTWDIPGDTSAFPWIGRQSGTQAVVSFLAETTEKLERIRLDVDEVLASDERAVVLGRLASKVRRTSKVVDTAFAIILAISEGRITRFRMLEDSFAVSQAAYADERTCE